MAHDSLSAAKRARNDEFYTQYQDIQSEVNAYVEYDPDVFRDKIVLLPCDDPEWSNFTKFFAQNFSRYGLKKLISTSYAFDSKRIAGEWQVSMFERESPKFDSSKTSSHGKIFTLTRDKDASGKINVDDLEWEYLEGDGDFRSAEVTALRDEADIIVTNPPFSLFREFLAWIMDGCKKFLIIGNQNVITYKEVFSLIKRNSVWLGKSSGAYTFRLPDNVREKINRTRPHNDYEGKNLDDRFAKFGNICWLTNLDHGLRHEPLKLMTMADNIKFSKHKEINGKGYLRYDNYNAIEVPFTDAIPSDFAGAMGVPITFLAKYCPEQFKILGEAASAGYNRDLVGIEKNESIKDARPLVNGKNTYARIFIEKKGFEDKNIA